MIESLDGHFPEIAETAWVHPTAVVIGDVCIGDDSSLWPGAVVRGDFGSIRIGARTCVQDNAVIHSDRAGTYIGNDCIVGHLAFIEEAIVGDECLVGAGARVLNGARLEPGAIVAAGAVVLGKTVVPTGFRAQGVPARIVSSTSPQPGYVKDGAARYVEMARRHARHSVQR